MVPYFFIFWYLLDIAHKTESMNSSVLVYAPCVSIPIVSNKLTSLSVLPINCATEFDNLSSFVVFFIISSGIFILALHP